MISRILLPAGIKQMKALRYFLRALLIDTAYPDKKNVPGVSETGYQTPYFSLYASILSRYSSPGTMPLRIAEIISSILTIG